MIQPFYSTFLNLQTEIAEENNRGIIHEIKMVTLDLKKEDEKLNQGETYKNFTFTDTSRWKNELLGEIVFS